MTWLPELSLAGRYVFGLLVFVLISVYGLVGLLLQLPLLGYVLLGYLTGTFTVLWRAFRAAT
jgi:hypothetical protein